MPDNALQACSAAQHAGQWADNPYIEKSNPGTRCLLHEGGGGGGVGGGGEGGGGGGGGGEGANREGELDAKERTGRQGENRMQGENWT